MNEDCKAPANIKNLSLMVRAQNDVYMVVSDAQSNPLGDDAAEALEEIRITRGELVRNASNILTVLMRSPAGRRMVGDEPEFEILNAPKVEEVEKNIMPPVEILEEGYFDLTGLKTDAGSDNQFAVRMPKKGIYTVTFKLKSDLGELSQSSMTILANNIPFYTITISGTNGEWVEREIELESFVSIDSYIDLVFAQSGIQVGEVKATYKGAVVKPHLSIE